jgi:hypothetical protein
MPLQAVALVRIPGWEPSDELDVRELEDAALVFLEIPFESEGDALLEALAEAIGPTTLALHDDERGVFVFPDAAEPEGAERYEDVLEAVGELGAFLPLDEGIDEDLEGAPGFGLSQAEAAEALQGALFGTLEKAVSHLGFGSVEELQAILSSQDPEVQKLAQIKMLGALERAMPAAGPGERDDEAGGDDEDEAGAREAPKR